MDRRVIEPREIGLQPRTGSIHDQGDPANESSQRQERHGGEQDPPQRRTAEVGIGTRPPGRDGAPLGEHRRRHQDLLEAAGATVPHPRTRFGV